MIFNVYDKRIRGRCVLFNMLHAFPIKPVCDYERMPRPIP